MTPEERRRLREEREQRYREFWEPRVERSLRGETENGAGNALMDPWANERPGSQPLAAPTDARAQALQTLAERAFTPAMERRLGASVDRSLLGGVEVGAGLTPEAIAAPADARASAAVPPTPPPGQLAERGALPPLTDETVARLASAAQPAQPPTTPGAAAVPPAMVVPPPSVAAPGASPAAMATAAPVPPPAAPEPAHMMLGAPASVRGPAAAEEGAAGLAMPPMNADLRHLAGRLVPRLRGAAPEDNRLQNARTQDRLLQALGNIIAGTGQAFSGPRGLPDRAALERQIAGLGGAEQDVEADMAREQAAKEAERAGKEAGIARGEAQAQRGAQERTRAEEIQREDRRLAERRAFEGQQGQLERASRERIAAGGQAGQAARVTTEEAGRTERERMREEARANLRSHAAARAAHHGGGGGAGLETAIADAVGLGIPEDEARHLAGLGGRAALERDVQHRRGAAETSEARAGQQRAGVEARQEAIGRQGGRVALLTDEQGHPTVYSTNLGITPHEATAARDGIQGARASHVALRTLDDVARAAAAGPLDPTIADQLPGARASLRAALGQMQNFGVLSEQERQSIDASLPNPENVRQWALGTEPARLRSWQNTIDTRVRAKLEALSVPGEQIDSVLRYGRTGTRPGERAGADVSDQPRRVRFRGQVFSLAAGHPLPEGAEVLR